MKRRTSICIRKLVFSGRTVYSDFSVSMVFDELPDFLLQRHTMMKPRDTKPIKIAITRYEYFTGEVLTIVVFLDVLFVLVVLCRNGDARRGARNAPKPNEMWRACKCGPLSRPQVSRHIRFPPVTENE